MRNTVQSYLGPLRLLQLRTWLRGDCWEWRGARNSDGYGQLWLAGAVCYAHRLSYEISKGVLPRGMVIDHLCRHPWCIRPSHLEAVSVKENNRRGYSLGAIAVRTKRCVNGHTLNQQNAYHASRGDTHCRRCRADRQRKYRAQRKAQEK